MARAGLSLSAGALGLGAAEIAARVLRKRPPPLRLDQFSNLVESRHRFDAGRVFEADPELFWRFAPNIRLPDDARPLFGVISNSQGLRAADVVDSPKAPDEVRILFCGDSCTFGYLVALDETFVAASERALQRRFPGKRIRCINAGVPGYSLFQGWRFLATRAARLQPDLVVLNFGWNGHASWDGTGDLEHYQRMRAERPIRPLRWSKLCRLFLEVVHDRSSSRPDVATRPRLLPHEFRTLLARSQTTVRDLGADLLMLVGAGRNNIERTRFRDYRTPLQEEQLRFGKQLRLGSGQEPGHVDASEVLRPMTAEHATSAIFFDEVHTTPAANLRVGEAVARSLEPWLRERLQV